MFFRRTETTRPSRYISVFIFYFYYNGGDCTRGLRYRQVLNGWLHFVCFVDKIHLIFYRRQYDF